MILQCSCAQYFILVGDHIRLKKVAKILSIGIQLRNMSKYATVHDVSYISTYGSGHETAPVLLPGFAIDSKTR